MRPVKAWCNVLLRRFTRDGISFTRPSDWEFVSTEGQDADWSVTISSPSTAFLQLYHLSGNHNQESILDGIVAIIKDDYPNYDCESIVATIGKQPAIGYVLNFITLDQLTTCQVFAINIESGTLAILMQYLDNESEDTLQILKGVLASITLDDEYME